MTRPPTPPAEVLREEFELPEETWRHLLPVTPETAAQLAELCETTPEFWLNLQKNYDITKQLLRGAELAKHLVSAPEEADYPDPDYDGFPPERYSKCMAESKKVKEAFLSQFTPEERAKRAEGIAETTQRWAKEGRITGLQSAVVRNPEHAHTIFKDEE